MVTPFSKRFNALCRGRGYPGGFAPRIHRQIFFGECHGAIDGGKYQFAVHSHLFRAQGFGFFQLLHIGRFGLSQFQQGEVPDEMPAYELEAGQTVLEVLEAGGLIKSRSEGRRLLKQNGVRLDGETLSDPFQEFPGPGVLQVGKRKFLRIN